MFDSISPVSPIFVIFIFIIALLTASILGWVLPNKTANVGRVSAIDGLRGVLVLGVFTHHSSVWYFYRNEGNWVVPPSNLYTHLGQSSVAVFFMITSFLFTSKILNSEEKSIDWLYIYISRLLRLSPLYFFSMIILFSIIFTITGAKLNESLITLLIHSLNWILFSAVGMPDLNGVNQSFIINSGVTWSLRFEWLFYFILPLLAFIFKLVPRKRIYLGVLFLFIILPFSLHNQLVSKMLVKIFMPFVGGIIAAIAFRSKKFRNICTDPWAGLFALSCFSIAVIVFPSAYKLPAILLVSIGFVIIACGNTLFGVLVWPSMRLIGDMGYSIYLLHGILLFIGFHFVDAFGISMTFFSTVFNHWTIVSAITVILIIFSYITFRFIELPIMRSTPNVILWLLSKFSASPRLTSMKKFN